MKEHRKTPRKQPKKPMTNGTLIQVPPGEDKTSFERHKRKNETIVKELMKVSYAMRRNDILENGHTFSITERYPFLGRPEYVR